MRCDQLAWAVSGDAEAERLKVQLGFQDLEWIEDIVTARSVVHIPGVKDAGEFTNRAKLRFAYPAEPKLEIEILTYLEGPSFHDLNPLFMHPCFVSHVGYHLEDGEDWPQVAGAKLVQETWTLSHTSKYLTEKGSPGFGRKYHYRIYQLAPGTILKFIKRVHPHG